MKGTYLLIDFFTVLVPLLLSFHPKYPFYKRWNSFFPAVAIVGLYFLAWDALFTKLGFWGFNEHYLIGLNVGNLPLEEVLFFFCIPYACVFSFFCVDRLDGAPTPSRVETKITPILIIIFVLTGIAHFHQWYTTITFLSLAILLVISKYVLHITWLGKFYLVYALLLLPFLAVNGILTGTGLEQPVVWYNPQDIMGIRIGTIPIEDFFYGMELILMNLLVYRSRQAKESMRLQRI